MNITRQAWPIYGCHHKYGSCLSIRLLSINVFKRHSPGHLWKARSHPPRLTNTQTCFNTWEELRITVNQLELLADKPSISRRFYYVNSLMFWRYKMVHTYVAILILSNPMSQTGQTKSETSSKLVRLPLQVEINGARHINVTIPQPHNNWEIYSTNFEFQAYYIHGRAELLVLTFLSSSSWSLVLVHKLIDRHQRILRLPTHYDVNLDFCARPKEFMEDKTEHKETSVISQTTFHVVLRTRLHHQTTRPPVSYQNMPTITFPSPCPQRRKIHWLLTTRLWNKRWIIVFPTTISRLSIVRRTLALLSFSPV